MVTETRKPISVMVAGLTLDLYTSLRNIAFTLPDFQRVDRVPGLKEVVEALESRRPDVVLVEMPLKGGNHSLMLREVARRNSHSGIIAVAPKEDAKLLLQSAFLGAAAFVRVDTPTEFLISTIRRVSWGEEPIEYSLVANLGVASELIRFLRGYSNTLGMSTLPSPLSPQQRKVLTAVAQGLTNREIGDTVGLQEQTVKNYMTAILKRVGARDRVQAVVYALKNGWIDFDEQLS